MSVPADDRARKIQESLHGLVEPEEKFVVSRDGDDVVVSSVSEARVQSSLHASHPALYARLLRANARIDAASGCGTVLFPIACLLVVLLALDMAGVANPHTFGAVSSALVLGLLLGFALGNVRERIAYRRVRRQVLEGIRDAGLSLDEVILAAHGDSEVEDIAKFLKLEDPESLRMEWGTG